MKMHDEFIAAYKNLEEALIKRNPKIGENRDVSPVRWAEDNYPDKASKLRYCRNTRNYIQHEGDYESFISVSQSMIDFLKDFAGELVGTAKSMSKTLKSSSVLPDNTVYEAVKKIKNGTCIPVLDQEKVYGILKDSDIRLSIASETLTKRTKVSALVKPSSAEEIGEVKESDSGEYVAKALSNYSFLVVRNKNGKITGVIGKEK